MQKRRTCKAMTAVAISLFVMSSVDANAMSFGNHHNNSGGSSQNSVGGGSSISSSSSAFASIDAPPYMTPVPEPSSIVLLGSGVFALGWWRFKRNG